METFKKIRNALFYLSLGSLVVLSIVAALSRILPTAKDLEPVAKTLLEMSGRAE